MLTVTRKLGERIRIGKDIVIEIKRVQAGQVRIGIEAPADLRISREEKIEKGDE